MQRISYVGLTIGKGVKDSIVSTVKMYTFLWIFTLEGLMK